MFIFTWLASIFTGGTLTRILDTIDKKTDAGVQRDQMKADVVKQWAASQAQVLTGKGWWIPLLFVIPVAFHFGAVCLYSVFWCRDCAYPQPWTIAALPGEMATWQGWIISAYFVGALGTGIISRIK